MFGIGGTEAPKGAESFEVDTSNLSLEEVKRYAEERGVSVDSLDLTEAQLETFAEEQQNIVPEEDGVLFEKIHGYAAVPQSNTASPASVAETLRETKSIDVEETAPVATELQNVFDEAGIGVVVENQNSANDGVYDNTESPAASKAVLEDADIAIENHGSTEGVNIVAEAIVTDSRQRNWIAHLVENDFMKGAEVIDASYVVSHWEKIVESLTFKEKHQGLIMEVWDKYGQKKASLYMDALSELKKNAEAFENVSAQHSAEHLEVGDVDDLNKELDAFEATIGK